MTWPMRPRLSRPISRLTGCGAGAPSSPAGPAGPGTPYGPRSPRGPGGPGGPTGPVSRSRFSSTAMNAAVRVSIGIVDRLLSAPDDRPVGVALDDRAHRHLLD